MLKHNHLLLPLLICIFSSLSVHASPWHSQDPRQNLVFSIAGGPTWSSPGQSQEFAYQPNVVNYYLANSNQTSNLATGELFLGIYNELNDAVQGQIGVEIGYSGNAYSEGTILQNNNPNQAYFDYSYNIRQFRTSVKAKIIFIDLPVSSYVQPYIGGSLGLGFNNAFNYQTSKLNTKAMSTPEFTSQTNTAFTYTIGGGIQIPVDPFWQFGFGYEFAGWGTNQLGAAPYQTENTGHGLIAQSLYTSTALVSLTYTS